MTSLPKMLILVNLALYNCGTAKKFSRDPVFMSVLVGVKSTTHLWDQNTPELAKKSVFTPKIAKKWIFERGGPKKKEKWRPDSCSCQNSEVPELNTIFGPIPLFLTLSSLTISYPHSFLTFNHNESSNIPIHNLAFQHCFTDPSAMFFNQWYLVEFSSEILKFSSPY